MIEFLSPEIFLSFGKTRAFLITDAIYLKKQKQKQKPEDWKGQKVILGIHIYTALQRQDI